MEPEFFATAEGFRRWLEKHHASEPELLVGYYKVATGTPSMSWAESVDEALCFGWIDGVRRRIDDRSYSIRFTPRREKSTWSAVNLKRVEALEAEGRLEPAGRAAYRARRAETSKAYSYERENPTLDPGYEQELRADAAAWKFFRAQAPWYRRASSWWVMSAKRETTRRRRLKQLIGDSAGGRALKHLSRDKS